MEVERRIPGAGAATRGSCEAAVALGVALEDLAGEGRRERVALGLEAGGVTLIGGASGVGKTTLLEDVSRAARERGWIVVAPGARRLPGRVTVELFGRDTGRAMRVLARAGLGEAGVFVRRARELSAGQRARLRLALAMERVRRASGRGREVLLALDEFASGLDRVTAVAVARLVGRLAGETGARVVVATAREDLEWALGAREVVRLEGCGGVVVERVWDRVSCGGIGVRIVEGSMEDYEALAGLHYRGGAPATAALVLGARDAVSGELAGVLVVSHPTLNGAWRRAAWADRQASGDRRRDAARLNREVRCISRVVVEPRYRSLGVARGLVRAYLSRPLTARTEAVAAMGGVCPFFERAGMREVSVEPSERDRRLMEVLERAGLERWRLAMPRAAWGRVESRGMEGEVARAVRVWANGSRATRGLLGGAFEALFARACRDVGSRVVAYVHERGE